MARIEDRGLLGIGLITGLFFVVIVGCRSAAHKELCTKDMAELKTWLKQLDGEGGGSAPISLPPGQILAVTGVRAGDALDAPTLTLDGGLIRLDGVPAGSLRDPEIATRELAARRDRAAQLWAELHPGKTRADAPYLVALGTEIRWSDVAALVDIAARASVRRLTFLFQGPTALTEPPSKVVAPFARKLLMGEAIDPSQKAPLLVAQSNPGPAESVFARCPDVSKELSALGRNSANPAEKNAVMNEALPRAIEACGCKVDINEVKALRWMQYGRYESAPMAAHTIAIAARGAADATEIAAPGSERWSTAHDRIVSAPQRSGARLSLVSFDP